VSRADDASAAALLDEYFAYRAETFPGGPDAYRVARPDPERFTPPAGVLLVVEGDDIAGDAADVGIGGVRMLDSPGSDVVRAEVKHLYIRPHVRGLGIGRALLAELERRAVELGATEAVLDTNDSLTAAGTLYRGAGYTPTEPYNDNPNATVWLRKQLT